MEIIASDLKEVLARLSTVLTNKGIVEAADKFVFNEETIHVFDGETFIRANFESGLKGAVEGQSILKYIDKLGTAKIELTQAEGSITVKKGRSIATFVIEDEENLPIDISEIKWRKAPSNFIQAITSCAYICSQDLSDMRLCVIHVKGEFAESTDEERINRFKLDHSVRAELLIPFDIVPYLSKAKVTRYAQTEDWMLFENQAGDLVCHRNITLGEDYQNLEQIVQECDGGNVVELPDKMYDAIEKAAIFQSDLKIKSDRKVTVRCKAGKIRIESHGTHGNFFEVLPTEISESFSFVTNPDFLLQIMEKSNTVFFHPDYIRIQNGDNVFLTSLANE